MLKDEVWLQARSLDVKKKQDTSADVKLLDSILLEVGKGI